MSNSTKKISAGPIACCSSKAVRSWKRTNNRIYRNKIKSYLRDTENQIIPGFFKKETVSYGPRDGSTIYWHSEKEAREGQSWELEAYKKSLRK